MSSGLFKKYNLQTIRLQIMYLIYMYKQGFQLNNCCGSFTHLTIMDSSHRY